MTNKVLLVGNPNFNLGLNDCEVGSYSDIGEAIAERPDLILLGQEGLESLQTAMDTSGIPVVYMSPAKLSRESTTLAFRFGCIDFIKENEEESLLLNKLKTYLCLSKITSINNKLSKIMEKTSCKKQII